MSAVFWLVQVSIKPVQSLGGQGSFEAQPVLLIWLLCVDIDCIACYVDFRYCRTDPSPIHPSLIQETCFELLCGWAPTPKFEFDVEFRIQS